MEQLALLGSSSPLLLGALHLLSCHTNSLSLSAISAPGESR